MQRVRDRRLNDPNKPQAYLLGYSSEWDGKIVLSVGDPDTAENVATYVPGTGTELANIHKDIARADTMAADANGIPGSGRTATVVWLGYDAPDDLPGAATDSYAEDGASDLRRFQTGLRATHEAGDARQTVIGHSYGTLVIGHAASDGHSLDADQAVLVASPGVDVDHAQDLSLRHHDTSGDNVWATTAKYDQIRDVPNWDIAHGEEPTSSEFDGNVFASDPGDPNNKGETHSKYWGKDNAARKNIAELVVGRKPSHS